MERNAAGGAIQPHSPATPKPISSALFLCLAAAKPDSCTLKNFKDKKLNFWTHEEDTARAGSEPPTGSDWHVAPASGAYDKYTGKVVNNNIRAVPVWLKDTLDASRSTGISGMSHSWNTERVRPIRAAP